MRFKFEQSSVSALATAEADGQPLAAERLRLAVARVAGEVIAIARAGWDMNIRPWPRAQSVPDTDACPTKARSVVSTLCVCIPGVASSNAAVA